jgi:hypothetical protein
VPQANDPLAWRKMQETRARGGRAGYERLTTLMSNQKRA